MDSPEMGVRSNIGRATFRRNSRYSDYRGAGGGPATPEPIAGGPFPLSSSSGTSAKPQARS